MTWNNFAKRKQLKPIILMLCSTNMLTEIKFFPQQNYKFEFFITKIIPSGAFDQLQKAPEFS